MKALKDPGRFGDLIQGSLLGKHLPLSGLQLAAVNMILLAQMYEKQLFRRDPAILDIADDIPADAKPFPKLPLGKTERFPDSFDPGMQTDRPPVFL